MSLKKPTAGIILAAGMSTRFGCPKQLLKLKEKYLLQWVIEAACASDLDRIILVLGHYAEDIVKALGDAVRSPRLHVMQNRHYRQGQSASLRLGLAEVSATHPSVMFLLGDQPMLDSETINALLLDFWKSDKGICLPVYHGRRGNPVLFSCKYYDPITALEGDTGARRLIRDNPDDLLLVPIKNRLAFFDIDTPEDYQTLKNDLLKPADGLKANLSL